MSTGAIPHYPATLWALVELARRRHPDRVLFADDYGRSLTGEQFRDQAASVAAGLHDLGIGPGSVVSWQLPTRLEALMLTAALARLGAVQNPIIPLLREREVTLIVEQVEPQVLFVPETWRGFAHGELARGLAAAHGFEVLIVDHDSEPTSTDGIGLPAADESQLPALPEPDPDAITWIYHSSGTTAEPKGIRHRDRSVMASATGTIVNVGMTEDDVVPLAFPVAHIGGVAMLTASLMTGARTVLFDTFDLETAVRMAAHGPTVLGTAVPFFQAFMAVQKAHGDEPLFPTVRGLLGGGAPVPTEINRATREVLGVPGVANGWGLTEFPVATFPEIDAAPEVLDRTAGRPVPGVEVRVVDGELRLRGPQCFAGYTDPELDVEAFDADGWFCTGDLGFVDDEGYVHVTGRIKDIIIRNAENISALEVEEALTRHPRIADAAVFGVDDAQVGERVAAAVVTTDGQPIDLVELDEHCRSLGLARQKSPERLLVCEVLPRNGMGKVLKQDLRAQLLV